MTKTKLTPQRVAELLGNFPPTAEQEAVITAGGAPLLVVAGAGSGKTETMTARVVHLVLTGQVAPEQILGLTFTRKAAGELAERVQRRLENLVANDEIKAALGPDSSLINSEVLGAEISTYNSFAAAIVRDYAVRIGANPDAQLITEADAWEIVDRLVQEWPADIPGNFSASTIVGAVLNLAGHLAEHQVSPEEAEAELAALYDDFHEVAQNNKRQTINSDAATILTAVEVRRAVMPLVRSFLDYKIEHDLNDFADQVRLATEIVRNCPEVRAAIRRRYRMVLLDEFQDTSVSQLTMLSELFRDHPVTAVGDPQQAIYGWRGASAASLESFHTLFGAGDTRRLAVSWRNDANILTVSNQIAQPLRQHSESLGIPELSAREGAPAGRVWRAQAQTNAEESDLIAKFLARRVHSNTSAAVLCRRRSDFAPIIEALRAAGVPCEAVGLGGLLTEPAVQDLWAALKLVAEAHHGPAAMRLLTNWRLGATDIATLNDWANQLATADTGRSPRELAVAATLAEAIENPPEVGWQRGGASPGRAFTATAHRRVMQLRRSLRAVRAANSLPIPELMEQAIIALDLDIAVAANPKVSTGREALDTFIEVAAGYQATAEHPSLTKFLAWLDTVEEKERGIAGVEVEPAPGTVQVMTVHGAKGLEWDYVVVPALVEEVFPKPGMKSVDKPQVVSKSWLTSKTDLPYTLRGDRDYLPKLELAGVETSGDFTAACRDFFLAAGEYAVLEERRLAYVAFTRARQELLLTHHWFTGSNRGQRLPSRFFIEADLPEVTQWLTDEDGNPHECLPKKENPTLELEVMELWPPEPAELAQRSAVVGAAVTTAAAGLAESWQQSGVENPGSVELTAAAEAALAAEEAPAELLQELVRDTALLLGERQRQDRGLRVEIPARLAATKLAGLRQDPQEFARRLRRPVPGQPSAASRLGTVFHAWMEQHLQASAPLLTDEELGLGPDLSAQEMELLERWQDTALRQEFWNTHDVVAVEAPRELVVDNLVIPCCIDLVLRHREKGEYLLVDWKTGQVPRSAEHKQAAALQLQQYRLVWSQSEQVDPAEIRACLVYVASGETRMLSDLVQATDFDLASARDVFARAITATAVPRKN